MARPTVVLTLSAFLVLGAIAAPAAEPDPDKDGFDRREFTCPIGGQRFTQDVGYSTLPFVTFPDGSYLGDEHVDAEIPVCPDNGLVILPDFTAMAAPGNHRMIYADYEAAELAQLPALISDPPYAALKPDGRHVQAYWLASKLGRSARTRFELLQRATWAATDPALRRRLVQRVVEEGPALIDASAPSAQARRVHLYFIVNALRELGRFDEALALMDMVERQGGPPVPAPLDPDNTYGADDYAPLMRALIAEKDMDRFPVRLMPSKWAQAVCGRDEEMPPPYGPRSATTRAACIRFQAEEQRRDADFEALMDMDALLEDLPALRHSCAATPPARRTGGLAMACESVEKGRDEADGAARRRGRARSER